MYFVFKDFMFILVLKYLTQNLPVNDNIQYILIMLPPFGQKLYFAMSKGENLVTEKFPYKLYDFGNFEI